MMSHWFMMFGGLLMLVFWGGIIVLIVWVVKKVIEDRGSGSSIGSLPRYKSPKNVILRVRFPDKISSRLSET